MGLPTISGFLRKKRVSAVVSCVKNDQYAMCPGPCGFRSGLISKLPIRSFHPFMRAGLLCLLGLTGCAGKIDPLLLESGLGDAQRAIVDAQRLDAETYAPELMAKATKRLEDAQQSQRTGNGRHSLELAFQAQAEAQMAAAKARQRIAKKRIDDAHTQIEKAVIQKMEYTIQTAQVHQEIAEEQARRALNRAIQAEQRAKAAQADADQARSDAERAIFRTQAQLAISRAELVLDAAKAEGALSYALDDYQMAENLIHQASSLLVQEEFDQAKSIAAQAESRANQAKIAARAGANAAEDQAQVAKLEAYTDANVAITRAQMEIDRAEGVNAFEHAQSLFQRAQTTLEQAEGAMKAEQYDQAIRFAAQAESSARDAYAAAEVIEQKRRAKAAAEEQIAQAKDLLFKADEKLNQASSTSALAPGSKNYEQVKTSLAEARRALANENYQRAIELGQQSLEQITAAIEKGKQIEAVETQILNTARAIPGAETEQTAKGVLIRFSGDLFDPGSSDVNPKFFPMLNQLAEIIKRFDDYNVRIEGHSDSTGDANVNLRLTEKRANGFMKYLIEKGGISAERLTAVGLGEDYPVADNRSPAGRDKNRRIDTIILTRE